MDGNDLSSYATNMGPLAVTWEEVETAGLDWAMKGVMLNRPLLSAGVLNTMFDNTATSGSHALGSAGMAGMHNLMIPLGIRGAPAQGDPVFCGRFAQVDYVSNVTDGVIASTWRFGGWDANTVMNYGRLWGTLLRPMSATSAVNSAAGVDDYGAATSAGGWLMYQVQSITGASGTVTISVEDSANNSTFAALSGATSGAIAYNAAPTSGIVQLATNATVRRYLRWQVAFSTVTAVTFSLAFVRGNGV